VTDAKRASGRAYCPGCGQKYAVPEEELKCHPGLRFRAKCPACRTEFSVRWEAGEMVTAAEAAPREEEPAGGRPVLPKGTRVDKYEIEEALASGGSSTVYRAFDWGANRKVALKVLHRSPTDSDYGRRFQREVEVQGNLKHPHLMPIFDHGTVDGKPFYTMELLHKPMTLDRVVSLYRTRRLRYHPGLRKLAGLQALLRRVVLPVARAIAFANRNGVIHRDLKPGNLILDARTLHVYVIDFGICHLFKAAGQRILLRGGQEPEKEPLHPAQTTGTLRCMPPEQAEGSVSERGDVWALGALVRYILTGDLPVEPAIDLDRVSLDKRLANLRKIAASTRAAGDEAEAAFYESRIEELAAGSQRTIKDVLHDAREGIYSPLGEGVDPALAAIVSRAMQVDPAARYEDAEAFASDIERWLEGRPVRAYATELKPARAAVYRGRLFLLRNRGVVTGAAAAIVLAALGAGAWRIRTVSKEEALVGRLLLKARREADPGAQEALLSRVLALRPREPEAKRLMGLTRRFAPLLGRIEEARRQRDRVLLLRKQKRFEEAERLAADTAAVLGGSVLEDLRALPEDYPGRKRYEQEVVELAGFLRGTRILVLRGLPRGVRVDCIACRSRSGLELDWDHPRKWGVTPLPFADRAIEAGSYVLAIRRESDPRPLLVPFVVDHATARRFELACPIDPARIPEGMCYVAGAKKMHYGDLRFSEEIRIVSVAPFFIDRYEVTNAEYARYVASLDPSSRSRAVPRRLLPGMKGRTAPLWTEGPGGTWTFPEEAGRLPVTGISQLDAGAYARWANKRLPTPEEWELAARGVDGRDYPFGMRLERNACNAHTGAVAEVGSFPRDRSPYGVFDMAGNVAEWTAGTTGEHALVKGGSFDLPRFRAAATAFGRDRADLPYPDVGFRCAR